MSLHFILDGYNIIKKIPDFSSKKLKDARKSFIRLIEEKRLTGSKKNKVTIVFDGEQDLCFKEEQPFKIIFTKDADQKIKDMVEKEKILKNIVVVTDDKEIKFSVKPLGVNVLDTEIFLRKIRKKKIQKEDLKSEISLQEQFEITEELKSIWLK